MAEQITFPQSGDKNDAEHFAALVGQDNLTDHVARGMNFTVDFTVPEVTISTGKAFLSLDSGTASSSGDTVLDLNHFVQMPQTTVSLSDGSTNTIFIEPDYLTDDNASFAAYTDTSNASADAFRIGTVDTSADTSTEENRVPDVDVGQITDSGGNVIYDDSNNWINQSRLENDSVTVAGNSVSLGGSTTVDYIDLNDTGSSFPIPNSDLSNSSVTVAGNSVSLGGSTAVSVSDLSDVASSSEAAGQIPVWNATNSQYENASLTGGTEIAITEGDASVTIDLDTPIDNADLSNDSVTVAGNSVSLGSSTAVSVSDLSDVASSSESAGQLPIWNASNSQYENSLLTGGNAISVTNGDASVTLDVPTDGIQTDELDLSIAPTWTGTHTFSGGINAGGNVVDDTNGTINQQRGDPTTSELDDGENMTYNSDGSGTGAAGDLVYAVNDAGTILTSIIVQRSNAT